MNRPPLRCPPPSEFDHEDSGDFGGTCTELSTPAVNSPRMWECGHCGGSEPDTDDGRIVVRCTRCGGPRPLASA